MDILVTASLNEINFLPYTDEEEIIQNVKTIISTPKWSVPLDREFGVECILLDKPIPIAAVKIRADIVKTVEYYEPRVKVTKVSFTANGLGKFVPKVAIKIVSGSS